MIPTRVGGFGVASVGQSVTWAAVPGDRMGITGAGARVPGAGAKAVLFSGDCCHLAGEVIDSLYKSGAVGGWTDAHERRLGCDLGDVRTAGCGVQAVLGRRWPECWGLAGWTKYFRGRLAQGS
jgi:hypothetical protein